jgi:hypothetical protein
MAAQWSRRGLLKQRLTADGEQYVRIQNAAS